MRRRSPASSPPCTAGPPGGGTSAPPTRAGRPAPTGECHPRRPPAGPGRRRPRLPRPPGGRARRRGDHARYLDYLGGLGIESIAAVDGLTVSGFLGHLREGDETHPALSASSVARAVAAVRGLHRFALADGLVPVDVSREVRPAAPPRRLPKAITVDDVERLLEAAGYAGTALALRDRALLELLYGTGARISEAVGLAVDDLDLTDNSVLLTGKGSKQ